MQTNCSLQQNGYVMVSHDVGDSVEHLTEAAQVFNDGRYHYVTFVRDGASASLRVDSLPINILPPDAGD